MKVGSIHKNSKTRYFAVGGYFSYEEDTIKIKAKYKKEKKLDLDSEIKSYDITEDEKIKIFNKIQELCSKSSNSRLHITRIKFTRK